MRRFVALGPLIPPSGTSSALPRTPGTSTIRMRCPASGRLIVRQSRLTRSLAGLSGACVAPRTALRPRLQKGSRIANRTIQGAPLYRSRIPPKRLLILPPERRFHGTNRQKIPLRCNRNLPRPIARQRFGGAHMEARCRVRLRRKA